MPGSINCSSRSHSDPGKDQCVPHVDPEPADAMGPGGNNRIISDAPLAIYLVMGGPRVGLKARPRTGSGRPSTSLLPAQRKDVDADPAFAWGRLCVGMTTWKRPLRHMEHLFPGDPKAAQSPTAELQQIDALSQQSLQVRGQSLLPHVTDAARWQESSAPADRAISVVAPKLSRMGVPSLARLC
jgi:hypothetical protein